MMLWLSSYFIIIWFLSESSSSIISFVSFLINSVINFPGTTASPSLLMFALIFLSIERSVSVALNVRVSSSATILIPSRIGFVILFEIALLTLKKASERSTP